MEHIANKKEIKWSVVFVIAAIHIFAIGFAYSLVNSPWQITVVAITAFVFGGLSITHLHRLFVHGSDSGPQMSRVFAYWTMVWVACSFQGLAIKWGDDHLDHHRFADQAGKDPHTPKDGAWWAHIGWLFYARDGQQWSRLRRNDVIGEALAWEARWHWWLVFLMLFVMPATAGWFFGEWRTDTTQGWDVLVYDVWIAFLNITLVRLTAQWLVTWLVNSAGHNAQFLRDSLAWLLNLMPTRFAHYIAYLLPTFVVVDDGKVQPAYDPDEAIKAQNFGGFIMAFISFGELLHGNHHEDAKAWEFGRKPSDGDVGAWAIKGALSLGLVYLPKAA